MIGLYKRCWDEQFVVEVGSFKWIGNEMQLHGFGSKTTSPKIENYEGIFSDGFFRTGFLSVP
jgi:hypothetical protein